MLRASMTRLERQIYPNIGNCEFCRKFSNKLFLHSFKKAGRIMFTEREKVFYFQPHFLCAECVIPLKRLSSIKREFILPKEEEMNGSLLGNNYFRSKMIRKLSILPKRFREIDAIYLLPTEGLPEKFKRKNNILVSFKHLPLINYYKHVLDNDGECLLHFWKPTKDGKRRDTFWDLRVTKLLVALSRIHAQSEILSIWVWADTRIVSIEFFSSTPARMIQANPKKVLSIK